MKAQKLGLVLGMNMAVACMMLQGCKANKPGTQGSPAPMPSATYVEPSAPAASVDTMAPAAPAASTTTVTTLPAEPAPVAPVVEPQPSQVATVKQLPPPAKKPAPVKAPAPVVAAPAAPAAAPAAGGFVYTVKPGDQLFAVSRRYNVKMAAIEKANPGLNPNRIRVGQKITIPGVAAAAPTAVAAAPATAPAKDPKVMQAAAPAPVAAANTVAPVKTKSAFKPYSGPTKEYKVRSGDSLGKIAYENGISIRALKELNKLAKDNVRVGQTLLVPAAKVEPAKVESAKAPVKDVKDVAKKPEPAKEPAAKAAEPAKEPAAKAVEPAKEPVAAVTEPVKESAPATATEPAKTTADDEKAVAAAAAAPATPAAGPTYTVKDGDDLVSVAIAWGISPSALMDLNDLKAGDAIKPGQVLKLPASAKQAAQ